MLSNLLEVVETSITCRGVEGNPEGVAVTQSEVNIHVFRCFIFLELLIEPRFKLAFEVKFALFHDVRIFIFVVLKELFLFQEQILLGFIC